MGGLLALGLESGHVLLYDLRAHRPEISLGVPSQSPVCCVQAALGQGLVACGCEDGGLVLWSLDTYEVWGAAGS